LDAVSLFPNSLISSTLLKIINEEQLVTIISLQSIDFPTGIAIACKYGKLMHVETSHNVSLDLKTSQLRMT
jgi:hypothetical protein